MLVFEEKGNRSTRRKPLSCRVKNQQTQPTYDAESRNRTWATTPSLHPPLFRNNKMADLLFDILAVSRQDAWYRLNKLFWSRFRFGSDFFIFLVERLREDLERQTSRNHALSPTAQVLVALRFFASGSFLEVLGDTVGLLKSTIRTIRDVSAALIKKREYVKWLFFMLIYPSRLS